MEEDVPIESKMITNRIRKAQEAVEAQNFEARKHLLEYDDVNNKQRQTVYGQRRQLLEGVDQKQHVMEMVEGIVEEYIDRHCPDSKHPTRGTGNTAQRHPDAVRAQDRYPAIRQSESPGDDHTIVDQLHAGIRRRKTW
jgi:preprotein translocase subunit SecA